MADQPNTQPSALHHALLQRPEVACFILEIFSILGGQVLAENGHWSVIKPEPVVFRLRGEGLPQLPGAQPHHQFHSPESWQGALRMADYWVHRLHEATDGHVGEFDHSDFKSISAGRERLLSEVAELEALTDQTNADPHDEALEERYDRLIEKLHPEIEALPHAPENAELRARIVRTIINNDLGQLYEGDNTTMTRLLRQIIRDLACPTAAPAEPHAVPVGEVL